MGTSSETSSAVIESLKPAAQSACENAHAAYSRFPVGAAIATSGGAVFVGCNVENASYPLTICAERNALAQAVAQGTKPGEVKSVLIYTPGDVAHSPCGACRQVMHELLARDAVIVSCCDSGDWREWTMIQLMPDPFKF